MQTKIDAIFFKQPLEDNYIGHIFSEVYKDQIFDRFIPQDKTGKVCLDIGANIGITTYYFSQRFDKVYSIEPSQEHFEVLTHMIRYNQLDNVEAHKYAVYIKEGEYDFFHNKNRTMYSLHAAVSDNSADSERVQTISIDKFFEDNNIKHCDLMKIDVEGSEHEIISSLGFKNIADKVSTVVTEWHEWSGRPMSQLVDALRLRGFNVEQVPSSANILVGRK